MKFCLTVSLATDLVVQLWEMGARVMDEEMVAKWIEERVGWLD